MIWRRCSGFPIRCVWRIFLRCFLCKIPVSVIWASITLATSSINSTRSNASSDSSTSSAWILLISSTSLTSAKRWLVESSIFPRHSSTFSGSFSLLRMICSIPIIPLIGVRISWLMRFINSVFALLSESAASKADCKRSFSSSSFSWKAEVFLNRIIPRITTLSCPVFSSNTSSCDIRTVFCSHTRTSATPFSRYSTVTCLVPSPKRFSSFSDESTIR